MQVTFVLLRAQVIYMTAADSADEQTYPETGLCNRVRKQETCTTKLGWASGRCDWRNKGRKVKYRQHY